MASSRRSKSRKPLQRPVRANCSLTVDKQVAQLLAELHYIFVDTADPSVRQQRLKAMRKKLRARLARPRTKRAPSEVKSRGVGHYVFMEDGTPGERE